MTDEKCQETLVVIRSTITRFIAAEPAKWAMFFALLLWVGCYLGLTWYFGLPENAGVFGDMFGAINALFSAATAVGLVFTIVQQQRQARLAEEDRADAAKDRTQAQKDAVEQRQRHAEEISVMKRMLQIEQERLAFEARPVFSLRWRDCSVKQDRSAWAILIANHGAPVFLLQYAIRTRRAQTSCGSIYKMCLKGIEVDACIGCSETFVGVIDIGFLQLRDGIQGTVTFEITDSRHREPRLVRQTPGPIDLSGVFDYQHPPSNSSANIIIPTAPRL